MPPHALAVTVGAGLRQPRGRRVAVEGAEDLARVLRETPPALESWWSGHTWAEDRRDGEAWEAACAIVLDVDREEHAALAPELAAQLDEAARDASLPGSLFHRTPAGARVVFVLDEPCTDPDVFDRAARGAADSLASQLRELSIGGVSVDPKPHRDLARLYFTPNSIAKGVPRSAEVVVMRAEPYTVEQLAELGGEVSPPPAQANGAPARNGDRSRAIARARAWLSARPPAVEGERGDERTFTAAATLVRDFDLDDDVALDLLLEWNQRCEPPWTEAELRAKVRSARKNGKHQAGAKLDDARGPRAREQEPAAVFTMRDLLDRELHRIEQGVPVIPTGFPRFDAAVGGGFQVPSLNVCGAGPKSLKSTWSQIVAARHAERGGAVFYLDLENGATRFLRRLLCRRSGLGMRAVTAALRDPDAAAFDTRDALERWREAQKWVASLPIRVAFTTPADLEHELRRARTQAPDRDLLAVFDSLQKLPGNLEERRATVDGWLRLLEQLREPLRAVFLVVSEIRRGKYGYEAREDAFKESGSIEYTADLAFTMSRSAADEDGDDVSTLRVELARDSDEDPKGDVASYRPVRPHYDLEELAPVERKSRGGRGKVDAARAWLAEALPPGKAVKVHELVQGAIDAGFSRATLYRARDALGDVVECTIELKKGWRRP